MQASENMKKYFEELNSRLKNEFEIAAQARKKGFDPVDEVEVSLAKNMAERVVGLISVVAPQIKGSGVVERIQDLEKEFGALDWRVALQIALEVAQEKFCKFEDKKQAIEVGVRTGFAYGTVGVVSAPLEGLISIDIKKRLDGNGEYFCLNYGGPIRNAGGTAAAWSVIISDYVRHKLGYAKYDPTEEEIKRCYTELEDYHDRVTNLQYYPSKRESEFMLINLPVEISGDPSEKIEVSNFKNLPRVPTNLIRSGFCLIHSSCIPLKAPKLWKQLSKWGKDFDMTDWNFLEDFLKVQKEEKSKSATGIKSEEETEKLTPVYTYIADVVAGRPVFGHPLKHGAFRLRYGRSRLSGYSAMSVHPATSHIMNDFIATGTHIKVERPSKGAALSMCDTIDGPIVKLEDGSVKRIEDVAQAKQHKNDVKEIIYAGDLLVSYGDFLDRAHKLIPPGYCEEWWIQELEKETVNLFGSIDLSKLSDIVDVEEPLLERLFSAPLKTRLSAEQAISIAQKTKTPLHPFYTYHWNAINKEQLIDLISWLKEMTTEYTGTKIRKGIVPLNKDGSNAKRALELIGVPHSVSTEHIILDGNDAFILKETILKKEIDEIKQVIEQCCKGDENAANKRTEEIETLEIVNKISPIFMRDKSGVFIGSRMGRPEKAKMRKLTGSPHGLFPVGEEGGRLRCFQSALEAGKIKADFPIFRCDKCNKETVFSVCEVCGTRTKKLFYCNTCGGIEQNECKHGKAATHMKRDIDIKHYFSHMLKKLNTRTYPDLIKGVRGTSNKDHIPEHLIKGILRAKYGVHVNKEGTVRYDCSELPITHFKPKETGLSIEKLKELGYEKDIKNRPLERDNQILEIKPQDIFLPACPDSPDEGCDEILFKVTKFIDELLEKLYGLPPYYNLKSKKDLAGHLIIGLAPHTSAGSLARIIGFSKTQTFLSHPLLHAAMRRDCDGDESCIFLAMDAFLNFSRLYLPESRGATMDAPFVLTSVLAPSEVDDMVFNVDIEWKYPLEFYEATTQYKKPWDVSIKTINNVLNTPAQYEGMGFTHDTDNFNDGNLCSAYKLLPSMQEKMASQMDLAEKLRAVNEADVATLVIEKHFIRDVKGNLRKFSQQMFRCVACNEKFRRPPLIGKCTHCGGKIIFTISEGSIIKYLEPSLSLANKYGVSTYLKQSLELLKRRVEGVFGKEKERQEGLGRWFG